MREAFVSSAKDALAQHRALLDAAARIAKKSDNELATELSTLRLELNARGYTDAAELLTHIEGVIGQAHLRNAFDALPDDAKKSARKLGARVDAPTKDERAVAAAAKAARETSSAKPAHAPASRESELYESSIQNVRVNRACGQSDERIVRGLIESFAQCTGRTPPPAIDVANIVDADEVKMVRRVYRAFGVDPNKASAGKRQRDSRPKRKRSARVRSV